MTISRKFVFMKGKASRIYKLYNGSGTPSVYTLSVTVIDGHRDIWKYYGANVKFSDSTRGNYSKSW